MKRLKICLVGNPNCGKSTLFNALTGARQRVGNWPGVTVERKSGYFEFLGCEVEVVDLPGIYTLTTATDNIAVDAQIACEAILSGEFDLVVNILDISNLERNLYLTTQLLEMGVPVLVAANMQDVAQKQHVSVDLLQLAKLLNCPIIGTAANQKSTIKTLQQRIIESAQKQSSKGIVKYTAALDEAVQKIAQQIVQEDIGADKAKIARYLALCALEGDSFSKHFLSPAIHDFVAQQVISLAQTANEEADILIADARYTAAHEICQLVVQRNINNSVTVTQKIDKIVLHRFLGVPIFLAAMYLMFFFSINVGSAFQPFFDQVSDALFIQGFTHLLQQFNMPPLLITILATGVGGGINTVVTFIPVIAGLFLFLSFLESSGYMARAAFVVDRCMRAIGLPGKAFVALIVGFGCNVPSMLAVRTLEHRHDRLLTLMMAPFMSCGARMAIYAVFTAAFFSSGGQNIVFVLYLVGILMAILTGMLLRRTVLSGAASPWIMELPAYHKPTFSVLLRLTWNRLKLFLFKAGKIIVPVCILISTLNAVSVHGVINGNSSEDSLLSVASQAITPAFSPMGIQQSNWPATVGLVTGVLAKEVVVGTLNTLYIQVGHLQAAKDDEFSLGAKLQEALASIPAGLLALKDSLINPIAAAAGDAAVDSGVLGLMSQYFDGKVGAIAYLLFVLLYFPCISAVAAMVRESSGRWACFSVVWTTGLAYIVAVVFYQTATFFRHPASSAGWIAGLLGLLAATLWLIKWYANGDQAVINKPQVGGGKNAFI